MNVPPAFRKCNKYHPVYKNKDLVKFLKSELSKGEVSIMQHGFCHSNLTNLETPRFDFNSGLITMGKGKKMNLMETSEFYGLELNEVDSKIAQGKYMLENTFNIPVVLFVSPQEYLTKSIWKCLKNNDLIYCGDVRRDIVLRTSISDINFKQLLKVGIKYLIGENPVSLTQDTIYLTNRIILSPSYRHYWNMFISDDIANYSFHQFKELFKIIKSKNCYFILLNHYWEYFYDWENEISQRRQYEYLLKLVEYMDKNAHLWKCTTDALLNWIYAVDKLRIKRKNNKTYIYSPFELNGLTIYGSNINIINLNKGAAISGYKEQNNRIVLNVAAGSSVLLETS